MGVRKRIVGIAMCRRCDMPIEGKAYRVQSLGPDVCMHLNCAYEHWEKMCNLRGVVPVCDINVQSDAVHDMFNEEAAEPSPKRARQ